MELAAMAAYSREKVAGLYGEKWGEFLNRQCPKAPFSNEQTGLLATGAYRPVSLDDATALGLLQASLNWVSEHREASGV